MKNVSLTSLCALLALIFTSAHAFAENPIIRDRFTADPAALVYHGLKIKPPASPSKGTER